MSEAVSIAVVYPDLLGTYGDAGNATILQRRLEWRGVRAQVISVELGSSLPSTCDVYLLGGGEDAPQALAADELRRSGALGAAFAHGAVVFAVCAGLQVVGERFAAAGRICDGVGLADITSDSRLARRAVGELVVEPAASLGLPALSGYENHASISRLGAGVQPFGRVRAGIGNGDAGGDGVLAGRLIGTYLHGPAFARNPELADRIVEWTIGSLPPPAGEREAAALAAADLAGAEVRRERLAAIASDEGGLGRLWRRLSRSAAVTRQTLG